MSEPISVTIIVADGFAQPLRNPVKIPNGYHGTLTFNLDPILENRIFDHARGGIRFRDANAPFHLHAPPTDTQYVFEATNDNHHDQPIDFLYDINLENPSTGSAGGPVDPTVQNEPPG